VTAAAYAVVAVILAGCGAYAASFLAGHQRLACLRRALAIHALIGWTLLLILAVQAARPLLHPVRHAGYLRARAFRRIPGRDPDGEPLERDEMRAFIAVVQCWKQPASTEGSRT
jgi:hypothetical protein